MPDANGGRTCRRQLLRGLVPVAVLAVGGLTASPGVSPAGAADTLRGTEIEVPVPLPAPIRADSDPVPDAPAGGGETLPTTVPAVGPSPAPAGGGVSPSPSTGGSASSPADGDTARTTSRGRTRARSAPGPVVDGVAPVVPAVVATDDSHDTVERLREASVPAARQFGLPLVLGAIVIAFLAVQGRVDRRDAKLMAAPVTMADDLLPFA